MANMTNKEYAELLGLCCPVCKKQTVSIAGPPGRTGRTFIMDCQCASCNSYWEDHYEITGYGELQERRKEP